MIDNFEVGGKVEHVLSKDWMLVLEVDELNKKVLCRTKTHEAIWFFNWELRIK